MLLSLENISFGYGEDRPLFEGLNLTMDEGKVLALIGESGSGKTTLLSLIYGLLDWQLGKIFFDGEELYGPKANLVPGEAEMKLVAQHYELMPYSTVSENVGKYISNIDLRAKRRKVDELLHIVGLQDFAGVLPKYLSGGQKQRVAIAQALSKLPKLLLLDEPFSNLDYARRLEIRERIFTFARKENIAIIISTHDLNEVLPWTDTVMVMRDGAIIQTAAPEELYESPIDTAAAELLGEVNIFNEDEQQKFGLNKWFYFPHRIYFSDEGIKVTVKESRFSGSHYRNKVDMEGKEIIFYSSRVVEPGIAHIRFDEPPSADRQIS